MLVWSVASSLAAAVLATEAARVLGAESAPGPSVVAVPMVAAATAAEAAETEFKAVLGLCGYRFGWAVRIQLGEALRACGGHLIRLEVRLDGER